MWGSILAYVVSRGPGTLSIDRIVAFNLSDEPEGRPPWPDHASSLSARALVD